VIAYQSHQRDGASPWVVGLGLVALLFNPLIPVHLTRGIWVVLNVGTALFLLVHMVVEREREAKT